MNDKISDKDKKDWENFLSKDERLPNKDINNPKIKKFSSKTCDLHGYSLDEANKKINDLILNAYEMGVNKLIIVTGKGLHSENIKDPYVSKELGILKYSVPEYINNNIPITISIGCSIYSENDNNMEELISRSDSAMYISKKNGRNRITFL